MIIKNISEVRASLSALLECVAKGEEILIGEAGKPVAKIVRFSGSAQPREPGRLKGRIGIASDFDDLPDDIAQAFGTK